MKKKIVLGITGGIAAVKIPELITTLRQHNHTIIPIMTHSACHIIDQTIIQKTSKAKVYTQLFDKTYSTQTTLKKRSVDHIAIADSADLIVIAPATANMLAKLALGIADDLLTTTILATHAPILICPSMNSHMWSNPIVQQHITTLSKRGFNILPPESGPLACGYEGPGRLPPTTTIVKQINSLLISTRILQDKRILITSGGTKEAIDDVRYITNNSSGAMAAAIADVCVQSGAKVTYLHAKDGLLPNRKTANFSFTTSDDLSLLIEKMAPLHDILFHVAAVSDFSIKKQKGKISSEKKLILELTPKQKLYHKIKQFNSTIKLITFKAEESMSSAKWYKKLQSILDTTTIDVVIGNPINKKNQGFSSNANEVFIKTKEGKSTHIPLNTKHEIANQIIQFLFSS